MSRSDSNPGPEAMLAHGAFVLVDVAAGEQSLVTWHPEPLQIVFWFEVPERGVQRIEPVIERGVTVQSATAAATGEIAVTRIGDDASDRLRFRDGTRLVDGLAAGRYRVTASTRNGAERGEAEVEVGDVEVAITVECHAKD